MEHTIELNLRELTAVIVRKLWLIVLSAIIFGALAYVYTARFVTPLYSAEITVRVDNSTHGEKVEITHNDLQTAQKLVSTYIQVIKQDSFLEKVSARVEETAGIKIGTGKLASNVTATSMNSTEMLSVSVSNEDPEDAAVIANTIAELVETEMPLMVPGSSAYIISHAKVPAKPYSPSYPKNITLGACIGALLVIVILVIQVLMDLHVKGEEDLRRYSDAPVLGYIPHYETSGATTGYEYENTSADGNSEGKAVRE